MPKAVVLTSGFVLQKPLSEEFINPEGLAGAVYRKGSAYGHRVIRHLQTISGSGDTSNRSTAPPAAAVFHLFLERHDSSRG